LENSPRHADESAPGSIEVPAEKGFTVSDITISGRKIEFGSQIADFITVKLTGAASAKAASHRFRVAYAKPAWSHSAARPASLRRCHSHLHLVGDSLGLKPQKQSRSRKRIIAKRPGPT
jgi:hypothetical protein